MDATTPVRGRNPPKSERTHAIDAKRKFHVFNMSFFSCIAVECTYAAPINHAINAPFSTGSHAQKPPQPSLWYAQFPPNRIPALRNTHATSPQRLPLCLHPVLGSRTNTAAVVKANGTKRPENPNKSSGGCTNIRQSSSSGFK